MKNARFDINFNAKSKKPSRVLDGLSTILFVFVLCVFCVFIAFSKVYTADQISGESMENTFFDSDIVYYKQVELSDLNYGDVVIIKTESKDIIKRVIGLSGDTIEMKKCDDEYFVFRNGIKLEEPYIKDKSGNKKKYEEFILCFDGESTTVGQNQFFVLGDNRANSNDSAARYGCFNANQIVGVVDYTVKAGRIPIVDLFIQLFLPVFYRA